MITLERPTIEHPLNATLLKLQASFTWVKLYTKPEGENWYSVQDIINQEGSVFTLLLERYQHYAPYLNKKQAVQNLFGSLAWWCASACYAPVLIDGRSPTNLEALHFRLHSEGYVDTMALEFDRFLCLPNDEAARHAKATVVSSREELVEKALQQLQNSLEPLITVARHHATIPKKALWLYLADDAAGLIMHVQHMLQQRETCVAEVETVLGHLPERGQTGTLEVRCGNKREYFTKRSTCCFYYLKPEGEKCATCPKLPLETQIEKLQSYLAKKVQLAHLERI